MGAPSFQQKGWGIRPCPRELYPTLCYRKGWGTHPWPKIAADSAVDPRDAGIGVVVHFGSGSIGLWPVRM